MPRIMYRSTQGKSPVVDRKTAIFQPQPGDGGIYVPTYTPMFGDGEIYSLRGKSLPEVDFACSYKFLKDEMPEEAIWDISQNALDFPIPIVRAYDNTFLERQGMGPTGAFKDTAGRKLSNEASYYTYRDNMGVTWLIVATSGDTGAAIRGGFYMIPGINVIIMYPREHVAPKQAGLMDRFGGNVLALSCDGVFDDLQYMAIQALGDPDLKKYKFWSANSLGIGRAEPQKVHAVYPLTNEEVMEFGEEPIFVVPSGNYGHTYAFNLARQMGAFGSQIVVANNPNNVFDRFMRTGKYEVVDMIPTISNAMAIADPSNLRRIFDMYGGRLVKDRDFRTNTGKDIKVCRLDKMPDMAAIGDAMWTVTVTDDETKDAMLKLYEETGLAAESHTGVGLAATEKHKKMTGNKRKPYVVMSTAHEAKFPEILDELGIPFEEPEYMKGILDKPSYAIPFSNDYADLKEFMLSGEAEKRISEQMKAV